MPQSQTLDQPMALLVTDTPSTQTSTRQQEHTSLSLSPPQQDECKTRNNSSDYIAKQRPKHNKSINDNIIITLEWTTTKATRAS